MAKQQTRQTRGNISPNDIIAQQAALGGKMPPQALELEEAVLGALLVEQDAFQAVCEILKPEHFYKEEHQRIYNAMFSLNARNSPTDLLLVGQELRRTGELESVGGMLYLAQLSEKVASAVNVEHHARIVLQKFLARALINISTEVTTSAYDDSTDIDELLEVAENKLFNLSQGSMKKEPSQIAPVVAEAIRQMDEAAKRTDSLSGYPSGYIGIDRVTSGWQKSTLVIIAARPAMGKTAFVLSMARKMAIDHGIPLAMFSLEMSNVELVKRMMTGETEIVSDKIKNGRLTPEDWTQFHERINRLTTAPIYIDDTPGLSVFDLRSKARILHKKYGIKCIIIDYLQLMTAAGMRPGNRQEEVSMISRSLKGLAKELEIPVIALSQLNRGVEQRSGEGVDGKRPQLSDLRESGAIEQDADMVCFIHRPEYYHILEDSKGNSTIGMAQFIIAKHRAGGLDDITLKFRPELVRFDEPNEYYNPAPKPMTEQTYISKMGTTNENEAGPLPDFKGNDGSSETPF